MKRLLKKSRSTNWPGPLMKMLVGSATPSSILQAELGSESVSKIVALTRNDLNARRNAATALFYVALYHQEQGKPAESEIALTACAELENPILAIEWYLARAKLAGMQRNGKPPTPSAARTPP